MLRLHTLGTLQLFDVAGQSLRAIVVQPKRIALLAYLAVAVPHGLHTRDQLMLAFWPDLTAGRARNALRQSLHHLRHHLGEDVVVSRGAETLGIRDGSLWCDATAFEEEEIPAGRDAAAVDLYRGPLLDGFHFGTASPEFEQWLDGRRRELAGLATAAAGRCADAAEHAGDLAEAARYAEMAVGYSGGDERLLCRALTLLDATGNGAAALHRYARYVEQLDRELDTGPSRGTRALVARIRADRRDPAAVSDRSLAMSAATAGPAPATLAPATSATATATPIASPIAAATAAAVDRDPAAAPARMRGHVWRYAALAATTMLVLVGLGALGRLTPTRDGSAGFPPALAASSRAAVTPGSRVVAVRLYEEGVGALNARDPSAAERLFSAAVDADSTFAIAAYSAARADLIDGHTDLPRAERFLRLAARQASGGTDRDRLVIAQAWADFRNDPSRLAIAETLAVRYPRDADGQASLGEARLWSGAFLAAIPPLQRAVRLDSTGLAGDAHTLCVACKAVLLQLVAFRYADSLAAAERVSRGWTVAVPTSPIAWRELAVILGAEGRYEEAGAAYAASAERRHEGEGVGAELTELAIRSGAFDSADALADHEIAGGNDQQRAHARWLQIISLRNQGRLVEALRVATAYRIDKRRRGARENLAMYEALPEAQVLLELGRPVQSAALFDSIAHEAHRVLPPRLDARNRAWMGTLSAEAHAAAGDTPTLVRLAASTRLAGSLSAYGRDHRLALHIDGLLETRRGNLRAAATAFSGAIFSPAMGYTRSNYDLAQVLLRLGRAREAIAVVQPAFRGDVDGSNMYVTRTELHEVLARAFERSAQPDSALAHYAAAAAALRHADRAFGPRYAAAVDASARMARLARARLP